MLGNDLIIPQSKTSFIERQFLFSIWSNGMPLDIIMEAVHASEFTARLIKAEIEDLPKLELPVILHWNMNHFVVLKSINKKSAVNHVTGKGKKVGSLSELSSCFTGVTLELAPSIKFECKEKAYAIQNK